MTPMWIVILGAAAVSYLLRSGFMIWASRLGELPPLTRRVLELIPSAALGALAIPAVFIVDGQFTLSTPRLVSAAIAALIAWRTRNLALTVVVGLLAYAAINLLPIA